MKPAWICRNYRPGDESGIIQLYREVFGLGMSTDLWHWAYHSSADGPAVIALLEIDQRIVGHYAVQPRRFWISGCLCTAGIAIGTMLMPEVRGIASLVAMARQAYATCRERGYKRLYAFPNDPAHKVRCTLLGWRALPEIVENDGPLPQNAGGDSIAVRVWRQMPLGLDFEHFAPQAAEQSIQSARSAAWLAWRFFDRPGGEYVLHTLESDGHVAGYAVTKRYHRGGVSYGHIVDWQLLPSASDSATDLLASVWQQFGQWNVERVSLWAVGDTLLSQQLADVGIAPTGKKTNFCDYDLTESDQRMSHPPATTDYAGWRVVMADSDVY